MSAANPRKRKDGARVVVHAELQKILGALVRVHQAQLAVLQDRVEKLEARNAPTESVTGARGLFQFLGWKR